MTSEGSVRWDGRDGNGGWHRSGRVIVVSNRGPVEYHLGASGQPEAGPGRGGMVTALCDVQRLVDVTWVAAALTEGDRRVAAEGRPVSAGSRCRLRLVAVPETSYDLYYNVFSNPILWFLHHGLWDRLDRPQLEEQVIQAWEHGYRRVNEEFADVVCEELARPDSAGVVLLQDYHLYLAPRYIREWAPDAVLHHFVHIPWPAPESWRSLPRVMVRVICDGLLASDVIRFQTEESLRNFLLTCFDFLPGARIDLDGRRVYYEGRWTRLRVDPIALDLTRLRRQGQSRKVMAYRKRLAAPEDVSTIVRVDRLDPAKNVLGGFQAYELLLEREPSMRGRVRFLAFLVPSRVAVPEYRAYSAEVLDAVERVNERFGTRDWKPIEVFYENNHAQALAGMSLYDALLVNSLADGMNLVSMEGSILNRRDGVVVLSRRAGSYNLLHEGALAIEPEDLEETADTLHRALTMAGGERRRRARLLKKAASSRDLESWLQDQLKDLATVAVEARRRRRLVAMPEDYRVAVSA